MLRRFNFLLAEAAAASGSGGASGGGKAPSKKKAKWIDRRSHKVRHEGKEPYSVYEQPSCALCHVRFRWVEDYQAHKQSALHLNRERWAEMEKWWAHVGEEALLNKEREDEGKFKEFLSQRSVASGISETALEQSMRSAVVHIMPKHCTGTDVPTMRGEITEPRDQRWPTSPKW